ncbi:MAG: radical SAM protein [Rhodothermia bacterium]
MLIKTTTSLCPECLTRVPANVVARDGRVFLEKYCDEHGEDIALLASDAALYWRSASSSSATVASPSSCGRGGCGTNHSCALIFEITEKCNLTCPTCFAGSSPAHTRTLPVEIFEKQLDRLLANGKDDVETVQLSGGEPTVHPDLIRMVEICFERNVKKVYINTNGIRLANDPDLARRLAAVDAGRDRLQFYLQFDGFADETYARIRGARGLLPVKRRAIERALAVGLFVLPVMTLTRGINLHEIGRVLQMVRDYHPRMTTLMLQPAFYSGRYENGRDERLTMAEVIHEVVRQSDGLFSLEDFGPIPCSEPNCFGVAAAIVRGEEVTPVSRYFPRVETWSDSDVATLVSRVADRLPQHMLDDPAEDAILDSLLDLLTEDVETRDWTNYRNFIVVAIKPFMDAHTYDQDRIDRCCTHMVNRQGDPVSFCEYNALHRPLGRL